MSGMLTNAEKWNQKNRILKVIVPYSIWILIYVVISSYSTPLQIPLLFIKELVLGNAAAIMYFIFVYCEFTLLIPLIDKLARSKYCYLGFVITPIEIVVMRLIPMLVDIDFNGYIAAARNLSCLGWFTYYYFGYLLGNNIIKINWSQKKAILIWAISIFIQIGEGYWYLCLGESNCGTQLKLSSVFSGALVMIMAYNFIISNRECYCTMLKKLGDISFGIYFSHLAIMSILERIPLYYRMTPYPINAIVVIAATSLFVYLGKKVLGKYAKYLAF